MYDSTLPQGYFSCCYKYVAGSPCPLSYADSIRCFLCTIEEYKVLSCLLPTDRSSWTLWNNRSSLSCQMKIHFAWEATWSKEMLTAFLPSRLLQIWGKSSWSFLSRWKPHKDRSMSSLQRAVWSTEIHKECNRETTSRLRKNIRYLRKLQEPYSEVYRWL